MIKALLGKLWPYLAIVTVVGLTVLFFYVKALRAENKVLAFENTNLKTTLEVRNKYIDKLNESAKSINEFKNKQYEEIDKYEDSPVSPALGPDFFNGLSRVRDN